MINRYTATAIAVAVGTFFSAGTMERGMKMSYSIRLAIGIALLYDDLQNKEEFVFSVDAPPKKQAAFERLLFFGGNEAVRLRFMFLGA